MPLHTAHFRADQDLLRATFSFSNVLDDDSVRQKLANGPQNTIVMRAYLLREGEPTPLAIVLQQCVVSYDLWNEVYRVRLTNGNGADAEPRSVVNIAGVVRLCANAQDLPIAARASLRRGVSHFLAVIVDVNPVSEEVRQQMRQWVQRPVGPAGVGPGDALFSAFVLLLVRDVGGSDRTVQFRTQNFVP